MCCCMRIVIGHHSHTYTRTHTHTYVCVCVCVCVCVFVCVCIDRVSTTCAMEGSAKVSVCFSAMGWRVGGCVERKDGRQRVRVVLLILVCAGQHSLPRIGAHTYVLVSSIVVVGGVGQTTPTCFAQHTQSVRQQHARASFTTLARRRCEPSAALRTRGSNQSFPRTAHQALPSMTYVMQQQQHGGGVPVRQSGRKEIAKMKQSTDHRTSHSFRGNGKNPTVGWKWWIE